MNHFLVRPPGPAFSEALSEHPERAQIDPAAAAAQHAAFVAALRACGATVEELPADPVLPDATFVSDCVVPLDGLLVVTRPGAESRRPETTAVAEAAQRLVPSARVATIEAPGTLDGGDVIVFGRTLAVGVSARTSRDGAEQLRALAAPLGYDVHLCPVEGRLHLASEITVIAPRTLVGTSAGFASLPWLAPDITRVLVPDDEVAAANVLPVRGRCVLAAGHPKSVAALRAAGQDVIEVPLHEFTRADGGPTCLVVVLG